MPKKKRIDELKSSEEKYQLIVAKRDDLNAEAQSVRAERDALNDKKRELRQSLDTVRDERRSLSERIADFKKKRDELQQKAKSLIEMKRKLRSTLDNDARSDLLTTKREMYRLEMEQQTIPRSLEDEAELLKRIKQLFSKVGKLEKIANEQKELKMSMREIDEAIDEAFKLANAEHHNLIILVEERKLKDEKIRDLVNEISLIIGTADKKHQEFLAIKASADQQHAKARGMRDKILEIRSAKRKERDEQRKAIKDLNESSKKKLLDKDKLEEAADTALEKLLNKGKIEL